MFYNEHNINNRPTRRGSYDDDEYVFCFSLMRKNKGYLMAGKINF